MSDETRIRLVEALVFASAEPVREAAVADLLQAKLGEDEAVDARAVLLAVQALYAGRGVELVEVGGGWQFRTAADLAPALTTVLERPRRLPRVAMETLAIVAYHQPCTRTEIEAIRGVSLGQQTLDQLLETGLIVPRGRKEVPGRPVLWGTSPAFLQRFGLNHLRDLPRREELLVELPGAVASSAPGRGEEAEQGPGADARDG
ncbi:SMC-Scp complex subunit ScpB [Acetobacteraceae bacterium KSS8]|uniref:SMC-Scp complex subunit ScpB n=1 Tax=Endosaccharibacter trunci TaxID=2812733 RepID=A0ABT1W6M2_9PROT|nr:SMC-Scp complex subunit ScpB [Acetobacteraceae bacterium KSS8]